MEREREEEKREKRKIGRKEGSWIGRKKWEGKGSGVNMHSSTFHP